MENAAVQPISLKRASRRVSAMLPATLYLESHGGYEDRVSAMCIDLSAGGVGLQLAANPMLGQHVEIWVHMPGGEVVQAKAEIVHTGAPRSNRCGLRFNDLDQDALTAIHSFIAARTH